MKLFPILLLFLFPQKPTCYKVVYTAVKGSEIIRSSEDTCMDTKPKYNELTRWIQEKTGYDKVDLVGVYPKDK
jgi:hypothetical protein